jgi:NADH-quinone oxidoreductase subunit F
MTDIDLTHVDQIIARIGPQRKGLISILQAIQEHYRYLPAEALERISQISEITPADVAGVSTFYDQFRHTPVGEHLVHVCVGTACHVKGSQSVLDSLRERLEIPAAGDTDPRGRYTIQRVACMGCCTLAPVARIDDTTYGHLTSENVEQMLADFAHRKAAGARRTRRVALAADGGALGEIRIGLGSCCQAGGSAQVQQALQDALAASGAPVSVKRVGCVGMCHQTPLVEVIRPDGQSTLYARVQAPDARRIVRRHFRPRGLLRLIGSTASRLVEGLLTDETWKPVTNLGIEVRDPPVAAFLGPQVHVATEHSGVMDPTDADEYARRGGFEALRKCLTRMTPEEVIDQVTASGCRGRGGAGFATGPKWKLVRQAPGDLKYVVCNADEGDPGAFMDRMLLESYPYRVVEGVIIGAYAAGAREGYFYIRAEYPLAVRRTREALEQCRRMGLLGENILGTGFSLDLKIMEGAGAFVCGEETALLASIEGNRGMPRLRPPFPAERGLWGKPTIVNNTETFALIPWIIRRGPRAFAAMGTEKSKGTKVFALAGKIRRGGLIEVPMGVTLRQIVMDIGGGMAGDRKFKAVQVGGPSGGCVPERLADTPVDYDALTAVGAMMGSGGLVVLDEDDCMVDIARYFLAFTQDQSCGKCTFCRVGTHHMLEILNRFVLGQAVAADIDALADLARSVKQGSLCGLGKTAPNPVLSTIEYFRDEYEAHVAGRCPARSCKALITYSINDKCIGCTRCAQGCPADAIAFAPYEKHHIDPEKCIRCGGCKKACPVGAVDVE